VRQEKKLHKVHIIRVERSAAGRKVPFDKMYVFQKRDADILPRVFNTSMVFPMTKVLSEQIDEVLGSLLAKPKIFSFSRWTEADLAKEVSEKRQLEALRDAWSADHNKYLVLVPVLFTHGGVKRISGERYKSSRKKHVTYPAYLMAKPGQRKSPQLLKGAMSSRAYFVMDKQVVRPLCLVCPKHADFLNDICKLGEDQCYRHLSRAKRSDFITGIELAHALAKEASEPEVEGVATETK
jgi:hypothetical protein